MKVIKENLKILREKIQEKFNKNEVLDYSDYCYWLDLIDECLEELEKKEK